MNKPISSPNGRPVDFFKEKCDKEGTLIQEKVRSNVRIRTYAFKGKALCFLKEVRTDDGNWEYFKGTAIWLNAPEVREVTNWLQEHTATLNPRPV